MSAGRQNTKKLNNNFLDNLEKSNIFTNAQGLAGQHEPGKKRHSQHHKAQFKNEVLDLSNNNNIPRYVNVSSNPQTNKSMVIDPNYSQLPSN